MSNEVVELLTAVIQLSTAALLAVVAVAEVRVRTRERRRDKARRRSHR